MKTVALLPTHGDPFMLKHFLVNYDRVWRGEVDELHVMVSGQPDPEVCAYMRRSVEEVGGYYAGDVGPTMDHGVSLRMLAEHAGYPRNGVCADAFLLVESDSRVRQRGAVSLRLELLRRGERRVIGSPRVSMSSELAAACDAKWGRMPADTTADGCSGYGLWPCFVFATADALLGQTDHNFSARGWADGEEVAGLGARARGDQWCADTFGSAALQLRDRVGVLPDVQYKGPWRWGEWLDAGHDIPWFHTGSLSSWGGSGGLTVAGDSELMDGRHLTNEEELYEWGHRVAWWTRFLKVHGPELPRAGQNYKRNVERMREIMGIGDQYVDRWRGTIDRLVCWEES